MSSIESLINRGWTQSQMEEYLEKYAKFLLKGLHSIQYFPSMKEHATSEKVMDLIVIEVPADRSIMWDWTKFTLIERNK